MQVYRSGWVGLRSKPAAARGAMMKKIGTAARIDAEQVLDRKIYLELFVKVKENWREDPAFLNEIDWRSMAGT